MKATKNICCAKDEISHCTVIRWFKKSCFNCKNLDDQTSLGMSKTMETNRTSSTQRVSGELSIS